MAREALKRDSRRRAHRVEGDSMARDAREAEAEVAKAVQAVRAGQRDAYAVLVEQFQTPILTLAMMLMGNRQAAEELTEDVFVRAYENLPLYDLSRPMKPWLVKIAYRLVQDAGRRRAMESRRQRLAQQQAREVIGQPGLLEHLIADERARSLWEAMERLPLAERTAAFLYYREELTVEQVAQATDVSPGTVKTLLFRARGHLRTFLQKRGVADSDRGAP